MSAMLDDFAVDPSRYRRVLSHFCSGVTIITAQVDGEPVGMTCQSFVSLSLDPPLVAFSPSRLSSSYPLILKAGAFCVNVLSEDQVDLCRTFAGKKDRWRDVHWSAGTTGSPRLAEVQAWIECTIEATHDAGDHHIVIGRVVDLSESERRPLLFYRGEFCKLST